MTRALDASGREGVAAVSVSGRLDATGTTARRIAAVTTAFAGAVHYAVVPEHRAVWWGSAVAFTLFGASQLCWGVLAWRAADRTLLALGFGGNVLVLAGWLVSRTVGLPFGPHAGAPESAGTADLAAVLAEAVAVTAITTAIALSVRRRGPAG